MRNPSQSDVIAIIGGGRWARVYLSVLAGLGLPHRAAIVSAANIVELEARKDTGLLDALIVPSLEELLANHRVAAAIVVNAARRHVGTCLELLDAGVPTLVEKPAALTRSEIGLLEARARMRAVRLVPALTFLHCSYLHRFAETLHRLGERPVGLKLEWRDASAEIRHGERKAYDAGLSVAQDVMPHVWSILTTVLRHSASETYQVRSCEIARGGRLAFFTLSAAGLSSEVTLERDGSERRRLIEVSLASGRRLALDFTAEPGTIMLDGVASSGDPDWSTTIRPVARLLGQFFSSADRPKEPSLSTSAAATVTLVEDADARMKDRQLAWLAARPADRVDAHVEYAIRDILSETLHKSGKVKPGDAAALQRAVQTFMEQTLAAPDRSNWLSALPTQAVASQ